MLWLDFESTSVDAATTIPLEVAFILTDESLNELTRASFVLPSSPQALADLPQVVRDMHTENGLLNDVNDRWRAATKANTPPLEPVKSVLREWCAAFEVSKITLAGSGNSHFDNELFARLFPDFGGPNDDFDLTYFSFDVGHLRRAFRRAVGHDLSNINASKTHRALDDVECHLDEARAFASAFKSFAMMNPSEIAG